MDIYFEMEHAFSSKVYRKIGYKDLYEGGVKIGEFYTPRQAEYAAHAINVHDSLVAEVDRLRAVIDEVFNVASADYILASAGEFGNGRRCSSTAVMVSINDKMCGEYEEKMMEAINSKGVNNAKTNR